MQRNFSITPMLLVCLAVITAGHGVKAAGPGADLDQLGRNIDFLSQNVLPPGWILNAVLKWDAYGNGVSEVAGVVAGKTSSVSVLENSEAAAMALATPKPTILRIKPANYTEVLDALVLGLGIQELASPLNIDELLQAANTTNTTIPVHLYLFANAGSPWGWNYTTSQELQAFINTLDPRYITVKGIMTHFSGLLDQEKPGLVDQFLQVACPVAANLSSKPVPIHWVSSDEALRLIPNGTLRMQPVIPAVCSSADIQYWARIGTLMYGDFNENNIEKLQNGTAPVFRWTAPVQAILQRVVNDELKKLAQVDLSPARYPHPSWWLNSTAYNGSILAEQYVYINKEAFQVSSVEQGGTMILVDITWSDVEPKVGDEVCIICGEQPLGDLEQVFGADSYNIALCLKGKQPEEGSEYGTPICSPPGSPPFKAPSVITSDASPTARHDGFMLVIAALLVMLSFL